MEKENTSGAPENEGAIAIAGQAAEAVEKAGGRENLIKQFGTAHVTLSAPFTWCDKTYKEINLDFERLTGTDMEAIDDELGAAGLNGVSPVGSRRYQRLLAARASGVPSDVIEHLPLADYNAVVTATRYF